MLELPLPADDHDQINIPFPGQDLRPTGNRDAHLFSLDRIESLMTLFTPSL